MKPENVLPPKRTLFLGKVRHNISIVSLPNKANPLNIFFSVEFVQLLQ